MSMQIGFQGASELLKAAAVAGTTVAGPTVTTAVTTAATAATTAVTTAATTAATTATTATTAVIAAAPVALPLLGVAALIWGVKKMLED